MDLFWLEEDGTLLFANEPSPLASYVVSTGVPCPEGFEEPLTEDERALLFSKSDGTLDDVLSDSVIEIAKSKSF